jgi:hypothetical protein
MGQDIKLYLNEIAYEGVYPIHLAKHMGQMRNEYKTLVEKLKGRNHLKDLGIDGRILRCILKK